MVWRCCYDVPCRTIILIVWWSDTMNFWEGMAFGLIITFGVLFVANKLKPKKSYWDLHKDAKYNPESSTPDYKGRK